MHTFFYTRKLHRASSQFLQKHVHCEAVSFF